MNLMKNLTYNNINSIFSFENVCLELNKFWANEKIFNNAKIWLTITVFNKQNKSFILINNLPFNTRDYTDINIVLKQVFETKSFSNRKDKINNIVFKYYLEDTKNSNKNLIIPLPHLFKYIIPIFIATYLILIVYVVFIQVDQLYNFEEINEEILNISNNIIKSSEIEKSVDIHTKQCVFKPFITLFNNSATCNYYPSYIAKHNFAYNNENICLPADILEYMAETELLKRDLIAIITEYLSINF